VELVVIRDVDYTIDLVRDEGRLISRIDPGLIVERRVHGPASDGYLTIVTWQQAYDGKFVAVDRLELSPEQQAGLLAILAPKLIWDGLPSACKEMVLDDLHERRRAVESDAKGGEDMYAHAEHEALVAAIAKLEGAS
jgi:hypothetical protein